MAHVQKPDFVFRQNGRVNLNRRRGQFSRLLSAEMCASAVVMLDTSCSEVVWRVLATHSIRQFPLTSPPVRHRVPSHYNWSLQHNAFLTTIKRPSVASYPNIPLPPPNSFMAWRLITRPTIPVHFTKSFTYYITLYLRTGPLKTSRRSPVIFRIQIRHTYCEIRGSYSGTG